MNDIRDKIDEESAKAFLRRHPEIDGRVYIRGNFIKLDQPTRCGHIYPREVFERELEKYRRKIEQGIGTVGFVAEPSIHERMSLENAAFVVRDMRMTGDGAVRVDVEFFQTGTGRLLKLLDELGRVAFAPRGVGRVAADGRVSDFEMEGVDAILLTYDP